MLLAAEKIVQRQGAGSLTYEELVQESGVSRGGITYHFPTKDLLLKALIERDIDQWVEMEKSLEPKLENQKAAELIGRIRAMTKSSEEHKRFVAGMLSAITFDKELLEPIREINRERCSGLKETPKQIDLTILELASVGLFWQDILQCHDMDKSLRDKVVDRLEQLAQEWSS